MISLSILDQSVALEGRPQDQSIRNTVALAQLCDPKLRERFGAAGRRRVKERFDLDRMCAETDAAYRDLLPHATPAPAIH